MKNFRTKIFVACLCLGLFCLSATGATNAADSDKFTLSISDGKIPANPNPAAVDEKVTFSFSVTLYHKESQREEVKPQELDRGPFKTSLT